MASRRSANSSSCLVGHMACAELPRPSSPRRLLQVGLPPGTISTGKLVAVLKKLGFDYVYGGPGAGV